RLHNMLSQRLVNLSYASPLVVLAWPKSTDSDSSMIMYTADDHSRIMASARSSMSLSRVLVLSTRGLMPNFSSSSDQQLSANRWKRQYGTALLSKPISPESNSNIHVPNSASSRYCTAVS